MSELLDNELAGKVAVITGSARGIGRAVAETMAAAGATVVISDLDLGAAEATAAEIDGADALACDVTDEAQVQALISTTVERHGAVDIAVANAGISDVQPLVEMSFADWRTMMSINLDGVFLTCKYAGAAMAERGSGALVTMASVTGQVGTPLVGHYAAAKAAVINLTKTLALELRPFGVRANAVCPGFAATELVTSKTPIFESVLGIESFDAVIEQVQGGYVELSDIANLTTFLASDRSKFCTGGAYVVDGGLRASLL